MEIIFIWLRLRPMLCDKTLRLYVAIMLFTAVPSVVPCQAKVIKLGASSSSSFVQAEAVYNPEPEIPSHLLEEAFQSFCIARFKVKPTGLTSVQIDTSSGSAEVDEIALETLRRWRFKPAMLDGEPVECNKRIKVEFKVD